MKPLSILLLVLGLPALAESRSATVIGIEAPEVLNVAIESQRDTVHLYGVDAPEPGQPSADAARKRVESLALGKQVQVETLGKDAKKRTLAIVRLEDGRALHEVLLQEGLVWWDTASAPQDARLRELTGQALKAGVGIWQEAAPVAPWDFRKSQAGKAARSESLEAFDPSTAPAKEGSPAVVTLSKKMIEEAEQYDLLTLVGRHQPRLVRDAAGNPVGLTATDVAALPLATTLGFRDGDIITAVNGVKLVSEAQIFALVAQFEDTKQFQIEVQRGNKPQTLHFKLP